VKSFNHDFFKEDDVGENSKLGQLGGKIGSWLLHLAAVAFLIYSGAHTIHASWIYASNNLAMKITQITGIVIAEAVLFGLLLAWHNQKITGVPQKVVAVFGYLIGFVLVCLGIVADSMTNSGGALPRWLGLYMIWGLPISPAIMGLLAVLVHELAPEQLQKQRQAAELEDHKEQIFKAKISGMKAELQTIKTIANMQLNGRQSVAIELQEAYNSDEIKEAIKETALKNLPALMAEAGIVVSGEEKRPSLPAPPPPLVDKNGLGKAAVKATPIQATPKNGVST